MSKITKNVITTKTKYDNTASYQSDDTNAYVPLTDVLVAGEGVSVTTDAQGRVVVSASGGGGGGGLNKYTYAFTTSNFNYTRLENIVKDAKGRIYLDLLGAYNCCYTGRTDSTICFEEIKFGLGNSIAVQFLFTSANVIKSFASTTEIEGTTPSVIMTETTDALSGVTITITYFNDTEITQ